MNRPFFLLLLCFAITVMARPVWAEDAPASSGSLALFQTLPSDPPPEAITRDSHYWISNEQRLDLFHDSAKDKGGVYIGVGSDQNYLLAGWAKSEVLVLMDFDQKIVDLHKVYKVAFLNAPNKEEFVKLWLAPANEQLRGLIKEAHSEPKTQRAVLQAHRTAQRHVARRFRKVIKQMESAQLPSFLTDDGQYNHIRNLYRSGKVFMVSGNLTVTGTMKAIGNAVEKAGMKVRILYVSNAEQYFRVRPPFRDNIKSLPSDDKSIVIRTNGWTGLALVEDTGYHYNVQSLESFKLFVAHPRTRSFSGMLKQATPSDIYGFSTLNAAPADTSAESRKRSSDRQRAEKKILAGVSRPRDASDASDESAQLRAENKELRDQERAEKKRIREAKRAEKRAAKKRVREAKRAERAQARDERRRLRKDKRSKRKLERDA